MIIDSSTLILLAKVGLLDLYISNKKLGISPGVMKESTQSKDMFDAQIIRKRIDEGKIMVKNIKNQEFFSKLIEDFNLGLGEAEAVSLAYESEEVLLTDDKKAINVCRVFSIKFKTALNILVELSKEKMINSKKVDIAFKKLTMYGWYSEELISKAKEDIK